ncbi:hypothetical protein MGG_08308 [Pyricularia oryzae 70-15]|uniref:Nuclear pore complex component n=3 Tax=Pyricularia oryzae TaxID=318829 RepID=G4MWV7_PYRO7|nr:uncharacterized protein MGG_08308 [Pyricularia oryzae 70-15]ELQ34449.1 hypothetical protein OOU_Y34scaffold00766g28 [Pyricularia oryzae Y34]KAI6321141.1 hypothetical protein MCOR34_002710 [Pyricularia oryzae]EHA55961.1 hypothetical protein MGG_08308 [Pyricularia oryzae 70-15]KAI6334033.1 hypothetical protein MCOR29_000867 [Pyricularia oryzae]KAI6362224.1 hypothetical protein MCOR31_008307 [Pyricularia oryzae]
MSSTTVSKGFSSLTPVGTPKKQTPSPAVDSPGNWTHPRLAEITKRQKRTTFTDKNARIIAYNVAALVIVHLFKTNATVQKYERSFPESTRSLIWWANLGLQVIPLVNILIALLPVFRKKDDLSDIPLTTTQRKLLGLPPSSAPATPGSVFSTPPRYTRTPSLSGSVGSSKSISGSPLSGSPSAAAAANNKRLNGSPFSPVGAGSPLFQKMHGRRSSLSGSGGISSALLSPGASNGSNLFGQSTASGTATPSPSGKRTSVGLNSKFLYEKGRRSSGAAGWLQ